MTNSITSWRERSEHLATELEEYAKNYNCKICNRYYCSHMIAARTRKFRQRIEEMLSGMVAIQNKAHAQLSR